MISPDHSGIYSLIFSLSQMTNRLCINIGSVLWRSESHDCVCARGQRPESDRFVILAAHVISTQHQRVTAPPLPTRQRPTERACYPRNKGQCTVSSHFRLTGRSFEREKRPANKHPLFLLQQDCVCCCALGCDVIVMVHSLRDLWAGESQIASSGGAHQLEHWFCFAVTPTHLHSGPLAQTQTRTHSSNNTKIEYSEFTVLWVCFFFLSSSHWEAVLHALCARCSAMICALLYHHYMRQNRGCREIIILQESTLTFLKLIAHLKTAWNNDSFIQETLNAADLWWCKWCNPRDRCVRLWP